MAVLTSRYAIPADAPIWADGRREHQRWLDGYRMRLLASLGDVPAGVERFISDGWQARVGLPDTSAGPRNRSPVIVANVWGRKVSTAMQRAKLRRAYDEQAIHDFADDYARRCVELPSLEACARFAGRFGVEVPSGPNITPAGARARMVDAMWWRRQLRRVWTRAAEECWRELGEVRKGRQPCVSDHATRMVIERGRRFAEWSQQRLLVADTGEALEMEQVVKASVAMPANRRTEMMVRIRGCGELAIEAGWQGQMFTLTCPSAFHPRLSKSGEVNPRYEGFTVRQGQDWLCRMWARARAKLARLSIMYMGIRTAEPHHDGTPHWHGVIWSPPQHVETLQRVLREHWMAEYADEPGARQHRCNFTLADPAKGGEMGLVGYAAKYVAKNIDGHGSIGAEDDDETGGSVVDATARKVAWNRIHGIRQFQLIGTAPVGLYRELRRLRDPMPGSALEPARLAADGGQWALFVRSLGGIERARRRVSSTAHRYSREVRASKVRDRCGPRGGWKLRPARPDELPAVWIERKPAENPHEHRAGWSAVNGYGEPAQPRVCGVVTFGLLGRYVSADTRPHRWRIERKQTQGGAPCSVVRLPLSDSSPRSGVISDLGPVAITVRGTAADQAHEVQRALRALADETAGPAPPGRLQ